MATVSLKLTGFKEFETKLKRAPKVLQQEIGAEIQDAAALWEQRAKQDAPTDQGRLRQAIRTVKRDDTEYDIVVDVEYAPYVEWGTKTKVRVPADIADYAAQFRGGTGGGKAKQMIYAWMGRVGIPKERQWLVFISIITNGINPHPFFFIQRPMVEKFLIVNIVNVLNTEH